MKWASVFLFATLALGGSAATLGAEGSSDVDLATGIRQVEDGYYDKAVVTLDSVVRRWTGDARHAKELERAHVWGATHPREARSSSCATRRS